MKNLSLSILSFIFLYLLLHINTNSVAGTPESEASTIQLGFFNIKFINETALLSWTTPQASIGSSFTIERSTDGKTYGEIGKVKATGSVNFTYIDYHLVEGINYYRFKKVDEEGKLTISPVRIVITDQTSPFNVSPRLVKSNVTISNANESFSNTDIKIISAKSGDVAFTATLASDKNEIYLDLSSIPSGNYVAQMELNGKIYNHTFVKQ